MQDYKVIKDFPSRGGAENYSAGTTVRLGDNTRTRGLITMGYIEPILEEESDEIDAYTIMAMLMPLVDDGMVDVEDVSKDENAQKFLVTIES